LLLFVLKSTGNIYISWHAFTDRLYNITAGIGLYQYTGLGCESSSSSSHYQGDVVVIMFSLCNLLAFIFFLQQVQEKLTKSFFLCYTKFIFVLAFYPRISSPTK
jgi:hypothetical protein